jgi:pimeloyl-ACP methyl ester carboxylesterase
VCSADSQSVHTAIIDGRVVVDAWHFRHATLVGVDGAGHWLHHDRLDEFPKIVRQFLAT